MEMAYDKTSVYVNFNGKQELSALCRTCDGEWVRSTIDLNSVLGNYNGNFEWDSSNFGASARNIELQDGKVLCAYLKRMDGSWTEKPVTINLTEYITNHDGTLRRSVQTDMSSITPDAREKLDAVSGLIRSQRAAVDNAAFELECITTANQRLVLQELEIAFLRLSKLATCIRGEFDMEQKDDGVSQSNPDTVLRPMIRSFDNISTKTDKALALVDKIVELTTENRNIYIPALQRDIDSLHTEIATGEAGFKLSLDMIQKKITESTAAIEENQLALKEAKTAKEKAKSMETLIKLSGWVLLPIGLGMNIAKVDGPFWEAIKGTEQRIKQHEDIHVKQQAELDELIKQETDYNATRNAQNALAAQLASLLATAQDLKTRGESSMSVIGATKTLADQLADMTRDLEDKGAMTDYQVSKKEYAAHVLCLLDMALPQFTAVGDVEGVLLVLEGGDDEKGTVKKELENELSILRRKLKIVKMLS